MGAIIYSHQLAAFAADNELITVAESDHLSDPGAQLGQAPLPIADSKIRVVKDETLSYLERRTFTALSGGE